MADKKPKIKQARLVKNKLGNEKIKIEFYPFAWSEVEMIRGFQVKKKFYREGNFKYWLTDVSVEVIQTLIKKGYDVDQNLRQILKDSYVDQSKISSKSVGDPFLDKYLREFQKEAVTFMQQNKGKALNVLPMGAGKTIVTLAFMRLNPEISPVVVVCPASLKINWQRETDRWLENPNVEILSSTQPYRPTGNILIINYDILKDWVDMLKSLQAKMVILDESTAIKNPRSKRTVAAGKLCKDIPKRVFLTGTPIESRPIELYNSIYMINPTIFPNRWAYAKRFCALHHDGFGWNDKGHSNTDELHKILTETILFRRKKEQIMPELPAKTKSFIPLEIENRKEYEEAEKNFIDFLRRTKGKKAAEKASNAEYLQKINTLRQLALKGKMKAVKKWMDDMLEMTDKLVGFAWHTKIISEFMKRYDGMAVKVDGSVSNTLRKDGGSERQDMIDRFWNDDKIRLILLNYEAGGKGYNLQNANQVIHIEPQWLPSTHDQATDRTHRFGQKEKVVEYYPIAVNTIEDYMIEVQDKKRKISSQAIDGEEVDSQSMLSMIIKKYLEDNK